MTPTREYIVSPTREYTVSPTLEYTVSPTRGYTVSPTQEYTVSPTREYTVSPTREHIGQRRGATVPTEEARGASGDGRRGWVGGFPYVISDLL